MKSTINLGYKQAMTKTKDILNKTQKEAERQIKLGKEETIREKQNALEQIATA